MAVEAGAPPRAAPLPAIPLRSRLYGFGSVYGKTIRDSRLAFIIAARPPGRARGGRRRLPPRPPPGADPPPPPAPARRGQPRQPRLRRGGAVRQAPGRARE